MKIKINKTNIGDGEPCYVVAEIGINHNGNLQNVYDLIDAAVDAGANAVKFQKRTPEICTPRDLWDIERETPWGVMPYIEYRDRLEFNQADYDLIEEYCDHAGIDWFVSVWDEPSISFMEMYNPIAYKIPSALLSNDDLLRAVCNTARQVILSTGGHATKDIDSAVDLLPPSTVILQCTATYPAENHDLNLSVIRAFRNRYAHSVIGYSGHERGIATTIAAVVLGAKIVERHITLDRSMWGSDQAASLEPHGFRRMVRDIRAVEAAIGSPNKQVLDVERPTIEKLGWHLWEGAK